MQGLRSLVISISRISALVKSIKSACYLPIQEFPVFHSNPNPNLEFEDLKIPVLVDVQSAINARDCDFDKPSDEQHRKNYLCPQIWPKADQTKIVRLTPHT